MKFNVINLGCKVNAYEAESTAAALEARGYTRCSEDEAADFSVIYTCAVTNMAAQKSRISVILLQVLGIGLKCPTLPA